MLIHDPRADVTASIDAPEAQPCGAALADKGWSLTHIHPITTAITPPAIWSSSLRRASARSSARGPRRGNSGHRQAGRRRRQRSRSAATRCASSTRRGIPPATSPTGCPQTVAFAGDALRHRLRARSRGRRPDDVGLAAAVDGAPVRYAPLLRRRVHGGQCPLRASIEPDGVELRACRDCEACARPAGRAADAARPRRYAIHSCAPAQPPYARISDARRRRLAGVRRTSRARTELGRERRRGASRLCIAASDSMSRVSFYFLSTAVDLPRSHTRLALAPLPNSSTRERRGFG